MKVSDIQTILDAQYPNENAYDWDNVGLQIGTSNQVVSGLLIALDLTHDVIKEAIQLGANMIVVHHPLLFRPISSIAMDSYFGQMISMLIKNDISVYIAHTNFDVTQGGMNHILGSLLALEELRWLDPIDDFTGLGVIGTLSKPMDLDTFIKHVKTAFQLSSVRVVGPIDKQVKTVAVTGGSGSSGLERAIAEQVDVYVTGDVTYHHALDAKHLGLTVIDAGHNIEKFALPFIKKVLQQHHVAIPIYISEIDTNPYIVK